MFREVRDRLPLEARNTDKGDTVKTFVIFFGEYDARSIRGVVQTNNPFEVGQLMEHLNRLQMIPKGGLLSDAGSWEAEEAPFLNDVPTPDLKLAVLMGDMTVFGM